MANDLPAFVSAALDSPVAVAEVFGNIGEQFFEVQVTGKFESVIKTVNAPAVIEQTLAVLSTLPMAHGVSSPRCAT